MLERLLSQSRFLVVLATISLLMGSIMLLVYGAISTAASIVVVAWSGTFDAKLEKALVIELINLVDLFLIAIVLMIVAAGLFQLYVGKLNMPPALQVRSLSELKEKLVSVIIVVLGVIFLGEVGEKSLDASGHLNLVELGVGVSLTMIALTVFLAQQAWAERLHHEHADGRAHEGLHPSGSSNQPEERPPGGRDAELTGASQR